MASAANFEVYETMAEILVTVRRIVHRGLIKVAGPNWYEEACPPGVYKRLIESREDENSIDRNGGENDELINYASLGDLAEIVENNDELAKRLQKITPEGPSMVDRLREVEALRLKLAAATPINDDEAEVLFEFYQGFRDAFARRGKKTPEQEPSEPAPPPSEEAAADEDADAGTDAAPEDIEDEQTGDEPAGEDEDAAPEAIKEEEAESDEAAAEDEGPFEDFGTVVTDEQTSSLDLAAVGRAMADGDDVDVLRVVRGEVMVVAEGVLQNDLQRRNVVWEAINFAGWYQRNRTELEIEPLEDFYAAVDEIREIHRTGGGLEAIKAHLKEVEFSKLLLALREMFLKHGI